MSDFVSYFVRIMTWPTFEPTMAGSDEPVTTEFVSGSPYDWLVLAVGFGADL